MISRNSNWRQGSCLTLDSSYKLNLLAKNVTDQRIVVISHECDLPNNNEEYVEVIIGSIIPKIDPAYSRAKNIRRLHIRYTDPRSSLISSIELTHSKKQSVPKELFARVALEDFNLILSSEERRVLKHWLAARYGRSAFPNAFENRLSNKKFTQKLADKLKPHEEHLIGVFFDLGNERTTELPAGQPYVLRITIVYDAIGGSVARNAAEICAKDVTELFHKAFGFPDIAADLALESCHPIAETHFSLFDIRRSDQWRVDYMSFGEGSRGGLLATGMTPI